MKRRGVLMIEVLLAALVASVAFMTFMSVSRSSYEYAAMTRNRAVAGMLARSLMAEIEAHPYGAEAPLSWAVQDERPVSIWIQGRPVSLSFKKQVRYLNSSFITPGATQDSDVVTITLTWREVAGTQTKQMVLEVPVWR